MRPKKQGVGQSSNSYRALDAVSTIGSAGLYSNYKNGLDDCQSEALESASKKAKMPETNNHMSTTRTSGVSIVQA